MTAEAHAYVALGLCRDTVVSHVDIQKNAGYFAADYDVTPDGQRILTVLSDTNDYQLVVSPNWLTEMREKVAESQGGK